MQQDRSSLFYQQAPLVYLKEAAAEHSPAHHPHPTVFRMRNSIAPRL